MKNIKIITTQQPIEFKGKHLPDREKPNWHYYETEDGDILHVRKEHMVYVIESNK